MFAGPVDVTSDRHLRQRRDVGLQRLAAVGHPVGGLGGVHPGRILAHDTTIGADEAERSWRSRISTTVSAMPCSE